MKSGLDIKFLYHWPGEASNLKSYWPEYCKLNISARHSRRLSFDRIDITKTFRSSYMLRVFFNVNFSDGNNKKRDLKVKLNVLIMVSVFNGRPFYELGNKIKKLFHI